jgi:asparagine synthase (glutamine-hydrolysing)
MRAVTLGFKEFHGTPKDEVPLARQVADLYGASHIVRYVDEQEFVSDLPEILAAMDQPSIDGVNTWFVSKAAREAGLKVAISGLGGDELLAGYPSFVDLPRWKRRFGAVAAVPGMGALSRMVISAVAGDLARAKPKMMDVLDYADTWQGAYFLRRGLFLPRELPQVLDPELAREGLAALQPLALIAGTLTPDPGPAIAKVCALESANYMRNQLLRDADWASMAHGLEVRVPLVDIELLRALAPAIAGMAPGEGKAALAHAPSVPLPDEVLNRAKTGFGVPTGHWMAAASGETRAANDVDAPAGVTSRRWSRLVLGAVAMPSGCDA